MNPPPAPDSFPWPQLIPFILPIAVFLWFGLIGWVLAHISGWARLARAYPASERPPGKVMRFQGAAFGWTNYNNCLTMVAAAEGLYIHMPRFWLMLAHKPMLIPWGDMHNIRMEKFLWLQTVLFEVAAPKLATLRVPRKVFLAARELGADIAPALHTTNIQAV